MLLALALPSMLPCQLHLHTLVLGAGTEVGGGKTGACATDYAGGATVCSCGESNGVCEGTYDGRHMCAGRHLQSFLY